MIYLFAGNLTNKITPNLRSEGKSIKYHYDFSRLSRIDYPDDADVYYTYGEAGAAYNRAGRIATVDNGTVKEERYYGKLGEVVKEEKTITDGSAKKTFTTRYEFDNLGRMRQLIYPNGETLYYGYDRAGQLVSAKSKKGEEMTTYLEDIEYNELGQRTKVEYGNGTSSAYSYDPVMHRLTDLVTLCVNKVVAFMRFSVKVFSLSLHLD